MGLKNPLDYTIRLTGIVLITGEIRSGKSTALRYAAGQASSFSSFRMSKLFL
jgi:dephospho-CoA kinase